MRKFANLLILLVFLSSINILVPVIFYVIVVIMVCATYTDYFSRFDEACAANCKLWNIFLVNK